MWPCCSSSPAANRYYVSGFLPAPRLACTGFRCFMNSYISRLAFGLEQYPPGECRTLLHFATSGYRLKLGSAVLPFCSLLLRLLLPCRLLLGAGVFDLFFSTCLVRLHKSKTLLPSLLFRFAFSFSSPLLCGGSPRSPRRLRLPRVPWSFFPPLPPPCPAPLPPRPALAFLTGPMLPCPL